MAPYCRELKTYLHEWDTIELRDDLVFKKRFRDVGNDAEYLFLMPAVLRKEGISPAMMMLGRDGHDSWQTDQR